MSDTHRWLKLAVGLFLVLLGSAALVTTAWQPGSMVGGMGPWRMGQMPHGMMWGAGAPWMGPFDGFGSSAGGTGARTDTNIPEGATVMELRQMRFAPDKVTVPAGTTVVFINRDPYPHRVVASTLADVGRQPAGFTSPVLGQGQGWSHNFSAAGTFPILCDVGGHHLAGMVGLVMVE